MLHQPHIERDDMTIIHGDLKGNAKEAVETYLKVLIDIRLDV
jgi:hypothetical protein